LKQKKTFKKDAEQQQKETKTERLEIHARKMQFYHLLIVFTNLSAIFAL